MDKEKGGSTSEKGIKRNGRKEESEINSINEFRRSIRLHSLARPRRRHHPPDDRACSEALDPTVLQDRQAAARPGTSV